MAIRKLKFEYTLTKEQFINLLLLNGEVEVETKDGQKIIISHLVNHIKYGLRGVEDGCPHVFDAKLEFEHILLGMQDAQLISKDGGATYECTITGELRTGDDLDTFQTPSHPSDT